MSKRNTIIREILSDNKLMEKYDISSKELNELTTIPPYNKKIIEIMATIINENDNYLNSTMIYKKLKKIHKI